MIKQRVIETYGPYGSQFPENFRLLLEEDEHIKEVSVESGAVVDKLVVVAVKPNGSTTTHQFGGGDAPDKNKIELKSGEYLTRISGTFGNSPYYLPDNNGVLISSIKIHTNLNLNGYGPYGKATSNVENVKEFSSPDKTDGPIVGVFGRSDKYLESIGVSIQKRVIENYGPYGSQFPENFRLLLEEDEHIKEVSVESGAVVDKLVVVTAKPNGSTTTHQFGGGDAPDKNKIKLKSGEYLTRISGTFGNSPYYLPDNNGVLISSIKIHTNLNLNGYGPYGKATSNVENVKEFSSPDKTDGPIVGVFGRSDKYLESIGVSIQKVIPSK